MASSSSSRVTESIPKTQRAWIVVKQGTPREALDFKSDFPVPKPKPGHVLVRVRAAALNPVGWKLMRALPTLLSPRPHVAEHDLAGVVVDASDSPLENGDEVIGFIPVPLQFGTRQGALAQYVTVPSNHLIRKPSKLSWQEAAGLPLAGQTALQGLQLAGYTFTRHMLDRIENKPYSNEKVFINGGSTAVGIYAIQLSKALGLRVVASASGKNEAFVRDLGADEFIDYQKHPLPASLLSNPPKPPFSMIFDAVGLTDTSLYAQCEAYLAPPKERRGGVYVSTGPTPGGDGWAAIMRDVGRLVSVAGRPAFLGGVKRSWKLVSVENKEEDMKILCELVERGLLKPPVDSTHAFSSALEAYDKLMTGRAVGKVVVLVD